MPRSINLVLKDYVNRVSMQGKSLIILSVMLSLCLGLSPAQALKLPDIYSPNSLAKDSQGNTYIAAMKESNIYRMNSEGELYIFAGTGQERYKEGHRLAAGFRNPYSVAVDSKNNLYVADSGNNRIRKIDNKTGTVSTYAGSDTTGHKDGKAQNAQFNFPYGIIFDKEDNLYVSDQRNHSIRKISSKGKVSTIAGTQSSGTVDGKTARFNYPAAIAMGSDDNVYVLDNGNKVLRKIHSDSGLVSTITDEEDNKSNLRVPKQQVEVERVAFNQ